MTSSALDLAEGTWEMARQMIGRPLATLSPADAVEAGAVRRLLEVHEWDYPPSYDLSAAETCGYEQLIAPASTYLTWALPAYWQPGDHPISHRVIPPLPYRIVPGEGSMMVATDFDVKFLRPILIGDRIHSIYWLRSVEQKTTRVGPGAFLRFEAEFSNSQGETVAIERTTAFRYSPSGVEGHATQRERPRSRGSDPPPPSDAFQVGRTEIELTLQRLVMAAGANRDFAPVHHDPNVAITAGMLAPFVNSMFVGTQLERTAIEWAGWTSRTVGLSAHLLEPARMGSVMWAEGWATTTLCEAMPGQAGASQQQLACYLMAGTENRTTARGHISLTVGDGNNHALRISRTP